MDYARFDFFEPVRFSADVDFDETTRVGADFGVDDVRRGCGEKWGVGGKSWHCVCFDLSESSFRRGVMPQPKQSSTPARRFATVDPQP